LSHPNAAPRVTRRSPSLVSNARARTGLAEVLAEVGVDFR